MAARQRITTDIGNALSFDGSTTGSRISATSIFDANNDFTLCGFFKIAAYPASSTSVLFKVGEGVGGSGGGYEVTIDTSGQLKYAHPGALGSINTGTNLSLDTWYHIALVRTSLSQLYIDGVATGGTDSHSFNSPHDSTASIGSAWRDAGTNVYTRFLNGIADGFRFYNRVLSTADLLSITARTYPDPVSTGSLAIYWKFDQTSGNAVDSSIFGRTLTVTNGTYVTGYEYIANIPDRTASGARSTASGRNLAIL